MTDIVLAPFKAVGSVLGAVMPKPPQPKQAPVPVQAPETQSVVLDALLSRQGERVNRRTGTGGAESATTAKKTLMGQ